MRVIITLNEKLIEEQGLSDEQLLEVVKGLGIAVRNEKMLVKFKVFTGEVEEQSIERLSSEPIITEISVDQQRHAI